MNTEIKEISLEQIKETCPNAFQETPAEKVSNKYTFVPTIRAIEDVMKLGWKPVQAVAVKSRKKSTLGVGKHMIKFEHPNYRDGEENIQLLLQNSHDGSSNFKLDIGIFRLVCSNGLVVKSKDMGSLKVRHMGYSFEEVQATVQELVERIPAIYAVMDKMKAVKLDEEGIGRIALKSIAARFDLDLSKQDEANAAKEIVDYDTILKSTRPEDDGAGLYRVFNRIQEKMVNGGFMYKNFKTGKMRKARPIKNFQQSVKINQKLWEVAELELA